jgi:AcrR family transcriptional regulator
MTPEAAAAAAARPRVEGDREQEILDAALGVLADCGYDRLTMDAVAHRAKASKATLYRRWNSKATLVVEALARTKGVPVVPDTGDLRTDQGPGVAHDLRESARPG